MSWPGRRQFGKRAVGANHGPSSVTLADQRSSSPAHISASRAAHLAAPRGCWLLQGDVLRRRSKARLPEITRVASRGVSWSYDVVRDPAH